MFDYEKMFLDAEDVPISRAPLAPGFRVEEGRLSFVARP